ncbi:MAG: TolC family protein [Planctomycetaceae bacterium]|nr:TolC family protein [Planctomycetaceae bacterium]
MTFPAGRATMLMLCLWTIVLGSARISVAQPQYRQPLSMPTISVPTTDAIGDSSNVTTQNADSGNHPGLQEMPSHADNSAPHGADLCWWEHYVGGSLLEGRPPYRLTLEQASTLALNEAPELSVLRTDWYIQQVEVIRQCAAFDWTTFVDTIWNQDNTPVGSQLDGALNRLRNRSLNSSFGLRRFDRQGGELTVSQSMGIRNSNSAFILPNNQGSSRLALRYERPLMRGAGEYYNSSGIQLAELSRDTAFDRFQAGVQDHLLSVCVTYWNLVLARGRCLQARASLQRAREITHEMQGRTQIDVTPQMLNRAESEVASRGASVTEVEYEVLSLQESLLRLIYGSRYTDFAATEVLTLTTPFQSAEPLSAEPHVDTALRQRSEVHQAIREIRAASLRYELAENEVLPSLNLVLSGYAAGLHRDNDVGRAIANQFRTGQPGVAVGLDYEIPYRNRAALAASEKSRMAMNRMQKQFEVTIGQITEEVREQVIERNKCAAILPQRMTSLVRAKQILEYSETRRRLLADGVSVADLYLENLLQMQSRLEAAEFGYLQSQIQCVIADNALTRATAAMEQLAVPALMPMNVESGHSMLYQSVP